MNIRELFDRKDELEDEIIDIDHEVKERWKKLIGVGCGYFDDWRLSKGTVFVGYEHRGSRGTDEIPVRFFEMINDDEAKEKYSKYMAEKKESEEIERKEKEKFKERKLYKHLKEKFEGQN